MKKKDLLRAAGLVALLLILLFLFLKNPVPGSKPGVSTLAGGPSSSVSRTDANGVAWALDQAGGTLLSMEPNAPKAGPPILVKADVQKVGDREMSIGLVLEGQAGEQYRPVVKKNGSPLSAPRLRIVNEAGQVMAQDSFQYG
ncbi:MAG: hypothetical protein NTZ17_04560 [Phycisphaerae bacterium]|nr:hypothetical protein [Phycisphaerae bacterium]